MRRTKLVITLSSIAIELFMLSRALHSTDAVEQRNLIANNSFEEDKDRDGLPDGYHGPFLSGKAAVQSQETHSGRKALKLVGAETSPTSAETDYVKMDGAFFKASVCAKGGGALIVMWNNAKGDSFGWRRFDFKHDDWQRTTVTVPLPKSADRAALKFQTKKLCYVDDVSLVNDDTSFLNIRNRVLGKDSVPPTSVRQISKNLQRAKQKVSVGSIGGKPCLLRDGRPWFAFGHFYNFLSGSIEQIRDDLETMARHGENLTIVELTPETLNEYPELSEYFFKLADSLGFSVCVMAAKWSFWQWLDEHPEYKVINDRGEKINFPYYGYPAVIEQLQEGTASVARFVKRFNNVFAIHLGGDEWHFPDGEVHPVFGDNPPIRGGTGMPYNPRVARDWRDWLKGQNAKPFEGSKASLHFVRVQAQGYRQPPRLRDKAKSPEHWRSWIRFRKRLVENALIKCAEAARREAPRLLLSVSVGDQTPAHQAAWAMPRADALLKTFDFLTCVIRNPAKTYCGRYRLMYDQYGTLPLIAMVDNSQEPKAGWPGVGGATSLELKKMILNAIPYTCGIVQYYYNSAPESALREFWRDGNAARSFFRTTPCESEVGILISESDAEYWNGEPALDTGLLGGFMLTQKVGLPVEYVLSIKDMSSLSAIVSSGTKALDETSHAPSEATLRYIQRGGLFVQPVNSIGDSSNAISLNSRPTALGRTFGAGCFIQYPATFAIDACWYPDRESPVALWRRLLRPAIEKSRRYVLAPSDAWITWGSLDGKEILIVTAGETEPKLAIRLGDKELTLRLPISRRDTTVVSIGGLKGTPDASQLQ